MSNTNANTITTNDLFAKATDQDMLAGMNDFLFPAVANGFTASMRLFSISLAVLSVFILGFMIIAGIVHSAYTGKVLGDKYHQIWAPLRVVFGLGFLVPLPAGNGLSAIDYTIKFTADVGRNLANKMAVVGISYDLKEGQLIMPQAVAGRDLARKIAISEACYAVYDMTFERGRTNTYKQKQPLPPVGGNPVIKPASKAWTPWGEDTPEQLIGHSWDYGIHCGQYRVKHVSTEEFGSFGADRLKATEKLIKGIRDFKFMDGIVSSFKKAGVGGFKISSSGDAPDLVKLGLLKEGLLDGLNKLGDQYNGAISTSASKNSQSEQAESFKKIQEGVEKYGWYIIGSMHRIKGRAGEKGFSFASDSGEQSAPDKRAWGVGYEHEIAPILDLVQAHLASEAHELAALGEALRGVGEEAGIFASVTNTLTDPIRNYLLGYNGWVADPTGDMQNLGHKLIGGSEVAFAAALAATAVAAPFDTASRIVAFITQPAYYAITASFIAGGVLAYILPLIPSILLLYVVVVLMMEIIAFMIASKLWMFVHVRMDGDDFVGAAQSTGYQLLFSVGLRQPITVLAFFGVRTASVAVQNLLLMTWNLSFISSQGASNSIGVSGLIFGFVALIFLQWHIELRMYSLMLEITSRVAAIFGYHAAGWGESGSGDAAIAAGVGMAAGAARAQSNPMNSIKGPTQKKDDNPKPNLPHVEKKG